MKRSKSPRLYRVLVPAKDLERSQRFYESLLSTKGRMVGGGRIYLDCGAVIFGLLDYSRMPRSKFPGRAESLYLATDDLDGVFRRARRLGCLAPGLLHGDPASPLGKIVVRPWGERSFYVNDPSGNPLCFVDDTTVFTGTERQVARLRRQYDAEQPSSRTRTRKGS
jgi:catechol 2,3-dioxygenase-like lactoylglutathione lyase family enzyme